MGRLIGIDYGTKRVGIAITDPLQIIASPYKTFTPEEVMVFLADYAEKEEIEGFVVGMPQDLKGRDTHSTRFVKDFVEKLKQKFPQKAIHLQDERFTSSIAADTLVRGGMKKKERQIKGNVDKVSAAIILQSYLESKD